jgi:type II secretory pathway pseudopilin PulG
MTLLESLVALVILGLAATGFLELFQQASAATGDTAAWARAVAAAEVTMERAVVTGVAPRDSVDGMLPRVSIVPWQRGLRQITVTVDVPPPAGASVVLERLVAAP